MSTCKTVSVKSAQPRLCLLWDYQSLHFIHITICPRFRELQVLLPAFATLKQSKSKQAWNFMHGKRFYERKREFILLFMTDTDSLSNPYFILYLHHLLTLDYRTKPPFPFLHSVHLKMVSTPLTQCPEQLTTTNEPVSPLRFFSSSLMSNLSTPNSLSFQF